MSETHHIAQMRAIFRPDNRVDLKAVTGTFFHDLDQAYPGFANHLLVSQFSFDEAWPTWEVHPKGDEMVILLAGDTDMVLAADDGSESVMRISEPGQYVVIPMDTWHTARPHASTSLLFLTPGEGTLNAVEPGGEPV